MNCIIDIDECQEHAEVCEEYGIVGKTAQCKNTVGSYECHCVNGYRVVLQKCHENGLKWRVVTKFELK